MMKRLLSVVLLLCVKINIAFCTVVHQNPFVGDIQQTSKQSSLLEKVPKPIDNEVYSNMFTYAHLIDISYCISSTSRIEEPFKCDLNCENRFPNVSLVYQWYDSDSVCGYIATTYSNIFNYDLADGAPKKTIILSLRGTKSLYDSYTDIKVDMVPYINAGVKLPDCGASCKVHRGFYDYYLNVLLKIDKHMKSELDTDENYELLIVGHSLGGSIALMIGLYYLDLGYNKMSLITMGQPLVGNEPFVNWVDNVMGSNEPVVHNAFNRKYFRVIHKDDVVATVPRYSSFKEHYSQFDNQIYLNCSATREVPLLDQVVDCLSGDNAACIEGDVKSSIGFGSKDYLRIHTTYFRSMGLCGIKII